MLTKKKLNRAMIITGYVFSSSLLRPMFMVRSLLIVIKNGRCFIDAGRENDDSCISQNSNRKRPRLEVHEGAHPKLTGIYSKNMMWCPMTRVQEKKTWMRSQKPKGLGDYFEQLINTESNDYYEQLVSMGSIKRLINKVITT